MDDHLKLKLLQNYDYDRKELIGTGSNGSRVFKIKNKTTQEEFALKKIFANATESLKLKSEFEVLNKLNHPNIIKFYFGIKIEEKVLILMEYAKCGDLKDLIQKQKNLNHLFSEDIIMNLYSQIISSVQYLHKKKIIHRDIKPENIFMTSPSQCKLGDFGIAKELCNTDFAQTNCGTPFYLAPEICYGKKYDYKIDIWTLGCLLYELCTLEKPFYSGKIAGLFDLIMNGKYKSLDNFNYSKEVRNVIERCLQKNPKDRPNADQIKQQLWNIPSFRESYKQIKLNQNLTIDTEDLNDKSEAEAKSQIKVNVKKDSPLSPQDPPLSIPKLISPTTINPSSKSGIKFISKLFNEKNRGHVKQNPSCGESNQFSAMLNHFNFSPQWSKVQKISQRNTDITTSVQENNSPLIHSHSLLIQNKDEKTGNNTPQIVLRNIYQRTKTTLFSEHAALKSSLQQQRSRVNSMRASSLISKETGSILKSKPNSTKGNHKVKLNEENEMRISVVTNFLINKFGQIGFNNIKEIVLKMTKDTEDKDMHLIKQIAGEQEYRKNYSYINYFKGYYQQNNSKKE